MPHTFLDNVKVVAFDAYGTVFDVHAAVGRHVEKIGPDARALSELWRAKQLEYTWVLTLAGRYENFWVVTERALAFALERFPQIDRQFQAPLMNAYRSLDAFPDVAPALRRLKDKGLKTVLFSNGEPTMLADAMASTGLTDLFHHVISVDDAKAFKTDPRAYALVFRRLMVEKNEIVLVSSNRWDIAGAAAYGFQSAWLNRAGNPPEYPGLEPDVVLSSLADLR